MNNNKRTGFLVRRILPLQFRLVLGSLVRNRQESTKRGDAGICWLRLFPAGPGELWCRLYGAGFVGVGTQLLFMRACVGCMLFWKYWLFYGLVGRVRQRVIERVMAGILKMAVPVHAGPLGRGRFFHRTFLEWLSR